MRREKAKQKAEIVDDVELGDINGLLESHGEELSTEDLEELAEQLSKDGRGK